MLIKKVAEFFDFNYALLYYYGEKRIQVRSGYNDKDYWFVTLWGHEYFKVHDWKYFGKNYHQKMFKDKVLKMIQQPFFELDLMKFIGGLE